MAQVSTSFPDSSYSASNKPSVATLKADISAIENALNEIDTNLAGDISTEVESQLDVQLSGYTNYTPNAGATATIDLAASNRNIVTMPAGNVTLALSNASTGKMFMIEIVQDSVGSRTVTWFSTIRWTDGVVPTLTSTASKKDSFGFICTGTGTYDGYIIGQNI